MKLFIVRHGQTDWNVQKILQGQQDTELNDTGISEAKEVAQQLANKSIHRIIASPLKRAALTAQLINEQLNVPLTYDERLKERFFGNYETHHFDQAGMDAFWNENEVFTNQGVEALSILRTRIQAFLDELILLDETILIVTHGVISAMIAEYFTIEPLDYYPYLILKNCEIAEYGV